MIIKYDYIYDYIILTIVGVVSIIYALMNWNTNPYEIGRNLSLFWIATGILWWMIELSIRVGKLEDWVEKHG